MNFSYIKSQGHLMEVPVIKQMVELYTRYRSSYSSSGSLGSFKYYYTSQGLDPVRDFVETNLYERIKDIPDYENIIDYVTAMFYSVKGTLKVFDYMGRFFNDSLEVAGDKLYNGENLTINLVLENSLYNTVEFVEGLRDFLSSLLWIGDPGDDNINITINDGSDEEIKDKPDDPYSFSGLAQVLGLNEELELYSGGNLKTFRVSIIKRDEDNS